eukprot:CAMPEP_0206449698 /NCGR_PEP_ID=MMETSP0324_2-20121206/18254_1 /ASSEMBLY_ACC=CAM_ASM_000836 /TAXON_ID=2866 /ORGANISM="Crypthecodinium cohnii, Strain Seligo" /LENGTH=56 /DNA_ID=CAMNT_0053919145 /DNA_START=358 /DNA_END=524 /DNA_ORIENTATION=+
MKRERAGTGIQEESPQERGWEGGGGGGGGWKRRKIYKAHEGRREALASPGDEKKMS